MTIELSDAERQMIELLRNDTNISLTVTNEGGLWHMRLEDKDSGLVGEGRGESFDRAWDNISRGAHLRLVD